MSCGERDSPTDWAKVFDGGGRIDSVSGRSLPDAVKAYRVKCFVLIYINVVTGELRNGHGCTRIR